MLLTIFCRLVNKTALNASALRHLPFAVIVKDSVARLTAKAILILSCSPFSKKFFVAIKANAGIAFEYCSVSRLCFNARFVEPPFDRVVVSLE